MKRILNTLLFLTFILTLLVPITGVHIHKLASVIFLILCLVHTGVYWKKMNIFRFFVLGLIFEVFLTGLFGMIFKQYPDNFVNSYDQFYCSCFLFGNTYFCI